MNNSIEKPACASAMQAPLGTIVLSAAKTFDFDKSTGEIFVNSSRKERFALQDTARLVLTNGVSDIKEKHRISTCCRYAIGEFVGVLKSKEFNTARLADVMTCQNIWACPVCGAIVSERRAIEVREACRKAKEKNLHVTMLSLTTRHGYGDDLGELVGGDSKNKTGITGAFRRFTEHRSYKRWRDTFGVKGFIRATEVTFSHNNGFHPHFHILLFSESPLFDEYYYTTPTGREKYSSMPELWQTCCIAAGLDAPDLVHGFLLSEEKEDENSDKAADYVTKGMEDSKINVKEILESLKDKPKWDFAAELTKWHSKKGKKESLTPFDFLRLIDIQKADDRRDKKFMSHYGNLFKEFVVSMKNKRQLYWSTGLREFLGMDEELTDEEVIEANENECAVFATLLRSEFKKIVLSGRRSELLDNAETCTIEQYARYLHKVCYGNDVSFSDYYKDFLTRIAEYKNTKDKSSNFDQAQKEFISAQRSATDDYAHAIAILGKYKNVEKADYDEYLDVKNKSFDEALNTLKFNRALIGD